MGVWLQFHELYFQETPWIVLNDMSPEGWHSRFVLGARCGQFLIQQFQLAQFKFDGLQSQNHFSISLQHARWQFEYPRDWAISSRLNFWQLAMTNAERDHSMNIAAMTAALRRMPLLLTHMFCLCLQSWLSCIHAHSSASARATTPATPCAHRRAHRDTNNTINNNSRTNIYSNILHIVYAQF